MPSRVSRRLQLAEQLATKYAPQIGKLFGLQTTLPTSIGISSLNGDAAQASYNGGVTFDRKFLRTTSRKDFKGALIHELTHVAGAGYGTDRAETLADAAREVLGPNDPNWSPSAAAAKAAERLGMTYKAPGPTPGRHPGQRRRNTGTQDQSKVAMGVLGPSAQAGYAQQALALQQSYTAALAGIKASGASTRAEAKSARADIRANRIGGTVAAEADALARGGVGSSADMVARAGVVAEAGTATADVIAARNSQLAQLKIQGMQANADYQLGLGSLATDKAAAEAELAAQRLQNDMFNTQQASYDDLYNSILKRLMGKRGNPPADDPRGNGVQVPGWSYDVATHGQPGWREGYTNPNTGVSF